MRSDAGEKHTALKKCFITPDYHGALTLLLLALPPAPIKSLILSASEKFFYGYFLYGVYIVLADRVSQD